MGPGRLLAASAALVLAAAASPAAPPGGVTPASGSPGEVLVLTGSGFGTRRPRVWLSGEASPRRWRLRVEAWSDTSVTARVRRARAGLFDVTLDPAGRGTPPLVWPEAFTVPAPEVLSVSPTAASPGDDVLARGLHFGNRRGSVAVGGVPARVLQWGEDAVLFRCPAVPGVGPRTVSVANRVGEGALEGALVVLPRWEGRGGRVLFFEGWANGSHLGKWSSIDRNEIDPTAGNRAPCMPMIGSTLSLAPTFRTDGTLRVSFDVNLSTDLPVPAGLALGMHLVERPYSNFDWIAALDVDAFERVVVLSFRGHPDTVLPFVRDDGWHRFTVAVDREGGGAWYRDGVLVASAAGLPVDVRVRCGWWGGSQAARLDNVRVWKGR